MDTHQHLSLYNEEFKSGRFKLQLLVADIEEQSALLGQLKARNEELKEDFIRSLELLNSVL